MRAPRALRAHGADLVHQRTATVCGVLPLEGFHPRNSELRVGHPARGCGVALEVAVSHAGVSAVWRCAGRAGAEARLGGGIIGLDVGVNAIVEAGRVDRFVDALCLPRAAGAVANCLRACVQEKEAIVQRARRVACQGMH